MYKVPIELSEMKMINRISLHSDRVVKYGRGIYVYVMYLVK
jgi:hypothetical protein